MSLRWGGRGPGHLGRKQVLSSGPGAAPSAQIGQTSHDTNSGNSANEVMATKVQAPSAGSITLASLTVRIGTIGAAGSKVRLLVYSDDGGSPSKPVNLLASSADYTFSAGDANTWLTLALTSPPTIAAGTTFWIGWHSENASNVLRGASALGSNDNYWKSATFSSGAPATIATPTAWTTRLAIYGNYTFTTAKVLGQPVGVRFFAPAANDLGAFPVTTPAGGALTVASLRFRLSATFNIGDKFKGVIYADNGGTPAGGALLFTTNEFTVAAGSVEATLSFASAASLTGGTPYWVGLHASAAGTQLQRSDSMDAGGLVYKAAQTYASGPPTPFPATPTAYTAGNPGIWFEYT